MEQPVSAVIQVRIECHGNPEVVNFAELGIRTCVFPNLLKVRVILENLLEKQIP